MVGNVEIVAIVSWFIAIVTLFFLHLNRNQNRLREGYGGKQKIVSHVRKKHPEWFTTEQKKKNEDFVDNLLFVDDKGNVTKVEDNKEKKVHLATNGEIIEEEGEEIGAQTEAEESEMLGW